MGVTRGAQRRSDVDECLGCTERLPIVSSAILARAVRPGERKSGWRLCSKAGGWHVPADQARELVDRAAQIEKGRTPVTCDPDPPIQERRPPAPGSRSKGTAVPGSPHEEEVRRVSTAIWRHYGWRIYDFEQGYRPDDCQKCGARIPGARTRVTLGVGDQMVVGHGLLAWIEYKREGKEQTDNQMAFGEDLVTNGQAYFVVNDPRQVADICRWVAERRELPSPEQVGCPPRRRR